MSENGEWLVIDFIAWTTIAQATTDVKPCRIIRSTQTPGPVTLLTGRQLAPTEDAATRSLPLNDSRRDGSLRPQRWSGFSCTAHPTGRSHASTATRSSHSRRASSSSTLIASSANHVAARRAAPPARRLAEAPMGAPTAAASPLAAAMIAVPGKCSAPRARAAAAKHRSRSARVARSPSTAATASRADEATDPSPAQANGARRDRRAPLIPRLPRHLERTERPPGRRCRATDGPRRPRLPQCRRSQPRYALDFPRCCAIPATRGRR
jgi:hypothetical protein